MTRLQEHVYGRDCFACGDTRDRKDNESVEYFGMEIGIDSMVPRGLVHFATGSSDINSGLKRVFMFPQWIITNVSTLIYPGTLYSDAADSIGMRWGGIPAVYEHSMYTMLPNVERTERKQSSKALPFIGRTLPMVEIMGIPRC